MANPVLSLRGVTKRFGGLVAVNGMDFDVAEREGQLRDPIPLADVYTELARRLGVLPTNVTHTTKPTLIN